MQKTFRALILSFFLLINTCFAAAVYQQNNALLDQMQPDTLHTLDDTIDFLIITPATFKTALEPLKTHKENMGLSTRIITLDDIYTNVYFEAEGRDNQEQIKVFLYQAKQSWSIQYVLLVGDKNDMPARYVDCSPSSLSPHHKYPFFFDHFFNIKADQNHFISDLYYADLTDEQGLFCNWDSNNNSRFGEVSYNEVIDEMDLRPDIMVGRVLCKTTEDITNLVQKIITYEHTAYQKDWFKQFIAIGGDTHPYLISELLISLIDDSARIALEGEYTCNIAASYLPDFTITNIYASGLYRSAYQKLTTTNINQAINQGAGFVLFSGHGYADRFGTHPPFIERIWLPYPSMYTIEHVHDLTNKDKLPVVIFDACSCGAFDEITGSIAWEMINQRNGGAIASFASTTLAFGPPSTMNVQYGIAHLCLDLIKTYAQGEQTIGNLWEHSINAYLDDPSIWDETSMMPLINNHITLKQWMYFGDPTLQIGGYNLN